MRALVRRATGVAAAAVAVTMSGAAAAGPTVASTHVPALKRVVVVVFENHSYDQIIRNPYAPTLNAMARKYALLTRYHAVARPSLPNYLALVSGSTQGLTTTCTECVFDATNLTDTIEASGRTWKTYAEGLPEPGFTGAQSGSYVKRHNPFLYFTSVVSRPDRLRRIVPYKQFATDLARRRLPHFSLVVPDLCNGMHDCSIEQGDAWLADFLTPLLASRQLAGGAVVVTFDEGRKEDRVNIGGHIATLILGPTVRPGSRSTTRLTHYALLRTIEDAWELPHLGRAATARPIGGIWK